MINDIHRTCSLKQAKILHHIFPATLDRNKPINLRWYSKQRQLLINAGNEIFDLIYDQIFYALE